MVTSFLCAEPISVTFLNPGNAADDPFFGRMVSVMVAAAKQLDIKLDIVCGDRDFTTAIEQGRAVCNRKIKPDYLLVINEDGIAERIIPTADSAGIKTVVFNEGFSEKYISEKGHPAGKYKNCISEIIPNDSLAGYILAKDLIAQRRAQFPNKNITIFGIEGSPRTNSSDRRILGLKQAVRDSKNVTLLQTAPANWDCDKASYITSQAIKRYPDIDILWCASDLMADGALQVKKSAHKNFLIGGIDWAAFAFDRVKSGEFASTVGGHFFDGVWALVVVKDHAVNGINKSKVFIANSFSVVNQSNVHAMYPVLSRNNWDGVHFAKYLRGTESRGYNFTITPLLKDLGVHE